MSQVIYKYKVPDKDATEIHFQMPVGSTILKVDCQQADVVFWALVYLDRPLITRTFMMLYTGDKFERPLTGFYYIGTVTILQLVQHYFEVVTE